MRISFSLLLALICGLSLVGAAKPSFAAEQEVPRTVIALYEGGPVQNTFLHTVAEMPMNHLGINLEYHDIHEPLPDITKRDDVRGVITWFYGDVYDNPEAFLKWAIDAETAGKKFVFIGSLGVSDDAKHYAISALSNRLLAKLGVKRAARSNGQPYDVTYEYLTPSMFLTSKPYDWLRPGFEGVQIINPEAHAHVIAHPKEGKLGDDVALIMTSPNGGYADAEYVIRSNRHESNDITQWLINPFEFFRLAFSTDDLPKPDFTTLAGRRIYYSNIDGDGWNNVTQLEEYRGKNILSSDVIYRKAIKAFPDLPIMVAPIAADIDTKWVGSEESRRVAREIFQLPQVEAGTHTYSHPFYWDFFEDADPDDEIPYLHLYHTPTWQPEGGQTEVKNKGLQLPVEFSVPRGFANEPFDINKEVAGSVKAIEQLLPKGKKVDILAWPGDCMPWEKAVHLTRAAKIQNINGGDTRFDPEYPAYASVAPVGRIVGKERQIYNSTSNENTYTDLWMSNFHAFAYLKKTIDNTESPMRLSASSIYYHMYTGEKEAGLNALLSNLKYVRTLEIAPITASLYTHIAEGFYSTKINDIGNNIWRIEDRGALQTIRFDRSTLKSVDFDRSKGVIGQRHYGGSLYVYLDEKVATPVIALKENLKYYMLPEEPLPYLVSSRWIISDMSRSSSRFEFTAQGYGVGDMVWHVPSAGTYRVTVNGNSDKFQAGQDKTLKIRIDEDAIEAVRVTVTETQND